MHSNNNYFHGVNIEMLTNCLSLLVVVGVVQIDQVSCMSVRDCEGSESDMSDSSEMDIALRSICATITFLMLFFDEGGWLLTTTLSILSNSELSSRCVDSGVHTALHIPSFAIFCFICFGKFLRLLVVQYCSYTDGPRNSQRKNNKHIWDFLLPLCPAWESEQKKQ